MIKVSTAVFKAKLSQYLRTARDGRSVVVLSHGEPVAKLVPFSSESAPVALRAPAPGACAPGAVALTKRRRGRGALATEWLREDRDRR
jgi:prevent-host-death family protein